MVKSKLFSVTCSLLLVVGSFLSVCSVHAAELSSDTRAAKARSVLTAIKANVTKYNLKGAEKAEYYRNLIAIYKVIVISLEKELGTTTGSTSTGSASTGSTGITCTGVYPTDANSYTMKDGVFGMVGSVNDTTNRVWKLNYQGSCSFGCTQGYAYNASKNLCEKETYAWACGFTTGGSAVTPASCNAATVGQTQSNCTCTKTTGTTPGSGGSTGGNGGTSSDPSTVSCTGNLPLQNIISTTNPLFGMVGTDSTNRSWKFEYNGTCSWKCAPGYVANSAKTACQRPTPGSGITIVVLNANGGALSNVKVDLAQIFQSAYSVGNGMTDGNGKIEIFPEGAISNIHGYLITVEKSGYVITAGIGCDARRANQGLTTYSYCGVNGANLGAGTMISITMNAASTVGSSSFAFRPLNGVFDMNAKNPLYTSISGIDKADTLGCYEVLAHPNVPSAVNAGYCNTPSAFTPFSGNNDWTWNSSDGGTWNAYIKYDEAIYGANGIKVRMFLKKKSTGEVATYDMSVTR